MNRKKWYVGVKYNPRFHCDIFKDNPDNVTEGNYPKYAFFFGGYNTKRKALQVSMYQNYYIDSPEPFTVTCNTSTVYR